MRLKAAATRAHFLPRHGSWQLILEGQRLGLTADLSMVVQGFRPSPSRSRELVDAGLVWVMIAKPPQRYLTALGKATLVSLAFDGALLDLAGPAKATERLPAWVTDFASGTAFLDELESQARSGKKCALLSNRAPSCYGYSVRCPAPPRH